MDNKDELVIYDLKDVMRILKISNKTCLRYINSGKLIATKLGGKWIVKKEDLDNLIDGR